MDKDNAIKPDNPKDVLSVLNENYIVEKSKMLLSCITESFLVGEYRLLDTYLSSINPRNPKSTAVVFTKQEYQKLLGLKKIKVSDLKNQLSSLSRKQVDIAKYDDEANNSQRLINLFSCAFYEDENKTIILKCNDDVKPLFFDIAKSGYIKYQLKNILNLRTMNAINIYNFLMANAFRKKFEISVVDFCKDALFINPKETYYHEYKRLSQKILSPALKEIGEKTNIKASYEAGTRAGNSGRVVTGIIFTILQYDDTVYLNESTENSQYQSDQELHIELLDKMGVISCEEFDRNQLICILDEILIIDKEYIKSETKKDSYKDAVIEYFTHKYHEMLMRNPQQSRYGYITKIIQQDKDKKIIKESSSIDYEALDQLTIPDV